MKIICYHNGADHQIERLAKFAAGLKYHGLDCSMVRTWAIEDCDLAVIWGHRQQNIINGQRSKGRHYLVMERGYIGDRFQWTSMGFDGLNGRAKFPEIDDGLARWNKHFDDFVKPWRETKGKTAVIMGQVHGDESIRGIDFDGWIQTIAGSLRAAGSDVWFRPHPARPGDRPPGLNVMAGALQAALDAAALVVTYNSNSGVNARRPERLDAKNGLHSMAPRRNRKRRGLGCAQDGDQWLSCRNRSFRFPATRRSRANHSYRSGSTDPLRPPASVRRPLRKRSTLCPSANGRKSPCCLLLTSTSALL